MIKSARSITVLASVLMAIISVMVALSLPAGYFAISVESMGGSLRSEIAFTAKEVEGLIAANPRQWQFEESRLQEILGRRLDGNVTDRRLLKDINGNVAAKAGEDVPVPFRTYRHPVYDGGDLVAFVVIERSIVPIINTTIAIGSFSILFGILIFIYFRYSPLRAVRTAYNLMAANERRLTLALESGNFGIWELDIKKGSMIWNDRMYDIYGLQRTSDQVALESWESYIHPDDRGRVHGVFIDVKSSGKTAERVHSEFRIIKPDGALRHIRADGLFVRDTKGAPSTLVCINQDITERKQAEEDLLKSEEYYRALTESASDILFIVDLQGLIKYVTPSAQWSVGYSPDEMIGRSAYEFILEEDRSRAMEDFAKALLTRNCSIFNSFRVLHKNGSVLVLEGYGMNLLDDPVIAGFVMNVRDVTARRQAEEALRLSEEKYRTIIENMAEGYFETDLSGRLIFFNEAARDFLGYGAEETLGLHYKKYMDEKNARRVFDIYRRVFDTGMPRSFEQEVVRKDGASRTIAVSIYLIADSTGQPTGFRGLFRDITYRKRAEDELRESERRLASIIEFLPEATFAIDLKGAVIAWNRAMEEMTGITASGILGKGSFEYSLPFYRERRPTLADIVLKPDPLVESNYENLERKGEVLKAETYVPLMGRYLSITAVRLRDREGKTVGAIQSISDITERKLLESRLVQAQKMEAIGTLAGGIAHDFNNILSVIIGYTEIARSKLASGDAANLLLNVLRAGDRAKSLINQILTFSRRADRKKRPVSFSIIAKEALKLLRPTIPSTIEIQQEIDSNLHVMADPTQIHQVLINLCTNAAHAMREKGGVLGIFLHDCIIPENVKLSADVEPGPYVKLTVFDTGTGIKPADLDRIFDPFFTTKEKGEGTGLGLSMVYGIVKECKGAIEVHSMPGEGSSFEVYIPGIGENIKDIAEQAGSIPRGSERVLFVDDEPDVARMAKEMMEILGYSIMTETSSLSALESFRADPHRYDVVITDMTMPAMTGKDLAAELLNIRPDIPIIMCTGYSEAITEQTAKQLGISEYLMKPVSMRKMAEAIRKALGRAVEP